MFASPTYCEQPALREQRMQQVVCVIIPGSQVNPVAPAITVHDETGSEQSVVISQIISNPPNPPDGSVMETITAGSYDPHSDSLYPMVPPEVRLQHGSIEIVVEQLDEHPCESVTVTLYVPAPRLFIDEVVAPLLHEQVYGAVPVFTVTDADPTLLFEQFPFTPEQVNDTV